VIFFSAVQEMITLALIRLWNEIILIIFFFQFVEDGNEKKQKILFGKKKLWWTLFLWLVSFRFEHAMLGFFNSLHCSNVVYFLFGIHCVHSYGWRLHLFYQPMKFVLLVHFQHDHVLTRSWCHGMRSRVWQNWRRPHDLQLQMHYFGLAGRRRRLFVLILGWLQSQCGPISVDLGHFLLWPSLVQPEKCVWKK
jgi:hypothetical protein